LLAAVTLSGDYMSVVRGTDDLELVRYRRPRINEEISALGCAYRAEAMKEYGVSDRPIGHSVLGETS
jgi:hypothetical protein